MNDPSPFTLLAFMLATAKRRGVDWATISGTSNQSDYLSHFVANHMFFRIALPAARRILIDHIAFVQPPRAALEPAVGRRPAHAAGRRHAGRGHGLHACPPPLQYADDCVARGMAPDDFLPRFTFFFDISLSFFEEIAKFRAGRRIWARLTRERYGAKDPRTWRFKFHAQTSGVDLTRQQPLNNIARVTVQAMAGHPRRAAVAAHRRLRRGAVLPDRVRRAHRGGHAEHPARGSAPHRRDRPAGRQLLRRDADRRDGSARSCARWTRSTTPAACTRPSRRASCSGGSASRRAGSRRRRSRRADGGRRQRLPGRRGPQRAPGAAEARRGEDAGAPRARSARTRPRAPTSSRAAALDALRRARRRGDAKTNIFGAVVAAAEAGCTHGEICATLRRELGFGHR